MTEKLYTVNEVAGMLRVTAWTVRQWLNNEEHPLVGIQPASKWLVKESDLKKYLESKHG